VASALAYTPRATEAAYVTTKAAVLAFSQCLRADWAGTGVGVTVACPGVINTPILESTRFVNADEDEAAGAAERTAAHVRPRPLARAGRPRRGHGHPGRQGHGAVRLRGQARLVRPPHAAASRPPAHRRQGI
jgi:NAD(P)-dependent dehydrogenase (short-subunit alcohol dehydrogenase family)